jgi:hypothetical protein
MNSHGHPQYSPLGEFIYTMLKWVLPPLLGAIIPAITFDLLLNDWTLDNEPLWSWVMVPIIPLASLTLLVLQGRWLLIASRTACASLTSYTVIMLVFGRWWQTAGGISVFIALLLGAVVLPTAVALVPLGRFAKATIFWTALFFGVGFPAALANGFVVMWRAESIAGDRPYCIQYASQTDAFAYETARTLFDLSALKMRQRLGTAGFTGTQFTWQDHAILVIDDRKFTFFNWSYNRENFLDEVRNRQHYEDPDRAYLKPQVFCILQRHYARQLPIWHRTPGKFDISISGRHFSIPEAYRPRTRSDGVAGSALVIDAASPDFDAYDPSKNRNWQFHYDVTIASEEAVDLSSVLKRRIAGREVVNIEPEFDLRRIQLLDLLRKNPSYLIYTQYDNAGRLMGLIDCEVRYSPRLLPRNFFDPNCRYMFVSDGFVFTLQTEGASQWQAIKQRLVDLLASFRVN